MKEDGTLGDYEYLTYIQLGRSIRKQFPWLKRQGRSGFYGKNCRDLQLYSLAMQSQDQISVPIYDTLGEEAVRFVIENSGMTVIAVTEEKLPLLSQFLVNPGEIKGIVLLNVPRASTKLTAFQSVISDTIKVIHFEDVGVRSFSPAADLRSLRGARRSFRRRLGEGEPILYNGSTTPTIALSLNKRSFAEKFLPHIFDTGENFGDYKITIVKK